MMHQYIHVKVRGQLEGVTSLLLPCVPRDQILVFRYFIKYLYPLSYLSHPSGSFLQIHSYQYQYRKISLLSFWPLDTTHHGYLMPNKDTLNCTLFLCISRCTSFLQLTKVVTLQKDNIALKIRDVDHILPLLSRLGL